MAQVACSQKREQMKRENPTQETSSMATTLTSSDCSADAGGIVACLRMLMEEAADLGMADTLHALRDAILACEAEQSRAVSLPLPRANRLH
jgi:hypothetical protein